MSPRTRHANNQRRKRGPAALRRKIRRAGLQPPAVVIRCHATLLIDAMQKGVETFDEHATILDDVMTELHGEDWDR